MAHEDSGNYAGKRPGAELNEKTAAKIKEKITENKITCAGAHSIAKELNVSPAEVGTAIDLLEMRIKQCQLGLFGHGKEKLKPAGEDEIIAEIRQAVESSQADGRITCACSWEIADRFNIPKIKIAEICEALKMKISDCQLGTFK